MVAKKYDAKNLLDHTVILKINTVPTAIRASKSEIVQFIEGKDVVLYPAGSIEFTELSDDVEVKAPEVTAPKQEDAPAPKVEDVKADETKSDDEKAPESNDESKSESAPKVEEKNETEINEIDAGVKAPEPVIPVTNGKKGKGNKASDVKIETEEK